MRVRYTYVREVYMLKILFYSFMIDRFCLKIYKNPIKFILMRKKYAKIFGGYKKSIYLCSVIITQWHYEV